MISDIDERARVQHKVKHGGGRVYIIDTTRLMLRPLEARALRRRAMIPNAAHQMAIHRATNIMLKINIITKRHVRYILGNVLT